MLCCRIWGKSLRNELIVGFKQQNIKAEPATWFCFSFWLHLPLPLRANGVLMEKFIINFNISTGIKRNVLRRISMASMIGITAFLIIFRPIQLFAVEPNEIAFVVQPEHILALPEHTWQIFDSRGARIGGNNRTLNLGPHILGRYDSQRAGKLVGSKIRWMTTEAQPVLHKDNRCDFVLSKPKREVSHSLQEEISRFDEKCALQDGATQAKGHAVVMLSVREQFRVYLVRRGDSLWNIAKRFDMNHQTLAKINRLNDGEILQVGRPLKVEGFTSRELRLNLTARSLANHPALLDQIRLIDGRPVPHWLVTTFVADVIDHPSNGMEYRQWEDGMINQTIVVNFQLVHNLLEGRARQYQPIVLANAERYNLDPALIMAMIHTESAFNPDALSKASAYGLMQLVPHTAGQEAYYRIYGQRRKLTPQYLYDPTNNIELGTAYLHILRNRYLGSITDPTSRTYCAVAGYHAGPSNVAKAFIPEASIKMAIPVINKLSPADVYKRLVEALPSIKSRNYVRDVIKRMRRYRSWYAKNGGTQT